MHGVGGESVIAIDGRKGDGRGLGLFFGGVDWLGVRVRVKPEARG